MKDLNHIKSDVLILLVGTSPMPNLIAACTRVKKDGKIYLLYTKDTEKIAQRLKDLIEEKSNLSITIIKDQTTLIENYDNPKYIHENFKKIFSEIFEQFESIGKDDLVIELVYNGGTKVMSTQAYTIFKEEFLSRKGTFISNNIDVLLTYLDGEASKIISKNLKDNTNLTLDYSKNNETLNIKIKDIIALHTLSENFHFATENMEQKNDVIMEIYNQLIVNESNSIDDKQKLKNALNSLNFKDNIELSDNINNILKNSPIKLGKYGSFNDIFDEYKTYFRDVFKDDELFNIIKEDLCGGKWFEKAIFFILKDIDCDDIEMSIENISNSCKEDSELEDRLFEIDLIALKDHKIHCISITTGSNSKSCKFKLYEIKLRTELLAGSEGRKCFISFLSNTEELRRSCRDIWDTNLNNTLIIAEDELKNLDERLKNWIIGGDSSGR